METKNIRSEYLVSFMFSYGFNLGMRKNEELSEDDLVILVSRIIQTIGMNDDEIEYLSEKGNMIEALGEIAKRAKDASNDTIVAVSLRKADVPRPKGSEMLS